MSRFVEGEDRQQQALLPSALEDYVGEDNPVRVIDAFVDELDLAGLGFAATPAATGRPAYHPATLLKLYIYGYLNRVQSSRRLEREAQRNVELMWLTGKLAPDHKTIANFRRDHGAAIRAAGGQFVALCRQLGLFAQALAAVDGSKFKAVNTRDKNFTPTKLKKRMEQVAAHIARYLEALDTADRQEGEAVEARAVRLTEKIATLRAQMQALRAMEAEVAAAPDGQVSLTDPDARSMATSGRGSGIVGYNVQCAVEAAHHLIVAHDVVMTGSRRASPRSPRRRGYPRRRSSRGGPAHRGPRTVAMQDQALVDGRHVAGKQAAGGAWDLTSCRSCAMKPRCTPSPYRKVSRWEHEAVLDAMQRRLDLAPQSMRIRRRLGERRSPTEAKPWKAL
jgi:transposase